MKIHQIYIICIINFFIINDLNGQGYIPLPDSNVFWQTSWSTSDCINSGIPHSVYDYYFAGDTLITGYIYKKLFRYKNSQFTCIPPYSPITGYICGIRQDTILKCVYIIPSDSLHEIILYNFDLKINDTIKGFLVNPSFSSNYIIIDNIDTVILAGVSRMRYWAQSSPIIIEGIGSIHGLIEPLGNNEVTGTLLCLNHNDSIVYLDPLTSSCDPVSIIKISLGNKVLRAIPNPNSGYFKIPINADIDVDYVNINAINILGQKVNFEIKRNNDFIDFKLNNHVSGLYLIYINNISRHFTTVQYTIKVHVL